MVLAGDAGSGGSWPLLLFFSPTVLRSGSGVFLGGGEGATDDTVDVVDFTDAIDGERFATPGLSFPDSGTPAEGPEDGRFVLAGGVVVVDTTEDAADGTRGREIVSLPVCVLVLPADMVDAVDVRREPADKCKSDWTLLYVVDASLVVDRDDVGLEATVGGRRLVEDPPPPMMLDFRAVGVLERTDDTIDGADDLGLRAGDVVVLNIDEDRKDAVDGVRGVTFVSSVFVSGGGGVLGSRTDERWVVWMDAELGANFESGRGPDGRSGRFDSGVGVAGLGTVVLRAMDRTELALDPMVRFCSLCEGVTLCFVVLRVSTLARIDPESASTSTWLRVALAR